MLKSCTDQKECDIIAASSVPINVFWVNHFYLKNPDNWPENRRYTSSTWKTINGVCVTYQSEQAPLESLGIRGDLWVMEQAMFIKEASGSWTPWNRSVKYLCPFDDSRRLVWSYNAHFRYLADVPVTERSEAKSLRGTYLIPVFVLAHHQLRHTL